MRVAVIAGGDPGHVFPAAALTAALTARGHQAVLCTGARWLPALARDGIPALRLPDHDLMEDGAEPRATVLPDGGAVSPSKSGVSPDAGAAPFDVGANPGAADGDRLGVDGDLVGQLRGIARLLAPRLAARLNTFRPDLVIADVVTPAGGLAAGLLGVPWLQLVPHPLADPSPHLPPFGSGLAPPRGPAGRRRDQHLYRLTAPQWARGERERDADRRALGLPPGGAPRARLIAVLPALETPRPDWPADAHQVGPLEWDPAAGELVPPPGDGPLVLLSASTVAGASGQLAQVTLAGLAELNGPTEANGSGGGNGTGGGAGLRLAWTVLEPPAGPLPPWVVAGPGRQEPLIDRAAVVICGGGHGMLAKALGRGTPVVTVPGAAGGEQRENSDRVRRAGLGVQILPGSLTPQRLAAAVRRVLTDPAFARAAEACRPRPEERVSADRAVDLIERTADL